MDVSIDVKNYQYKGSQQLVYTNNSSDTLKKVYYHLFNNAFQPGSEMDARIQSIKDPDGRMVNKIKVDGKEIIKKRTKKIESKVKSKYVNKTTKSDPNGVWKLSPFLDKITEKEYQEIVSKLEDGLSFGGCGWCI